MRLRDLQESFVLSIVKNEATPEILKQLQPGGHLPDALAAWQVYRNGYPARLSEALGETYEAVWSVLGDDEFFALCERYLNENPSKNYNLSNYGENFSSFLKTDQSLSEFPFLSELAFFEWEFHELFHKAPDTVIHWSPGSLASVDENTRFVFISTLRLFRFSHGVYSIWKKRAENERSLNPSTVSRPETAILFKAGSQMLQSSLLEPGQYEILSRLVSGQTLQNALESAEDEQAVGSLFSLMVRYGLIAEILKG